MATVSSSVTGLASIADDGTDTGTLNITSGTLASTSLSQFTGYSTINVSANAAHVIDVPTTILASTSATVTMVVTSTIGVSFTGANLTGTQLKVNLTASEGADTITGGPDDDTLVGGDGNDLIRGGSGNGDDVISGGAGDDTVTGGDGADSLFGSDGAELMYGNVGNDLLSGGSAADTL
jgi:Ca2+-binding RTX toxin-like protein